MRQRILFIILLVVLVLVGYTIFRPKPKSKARVQVSEKPAASIKTTTATNVPIPVETSKGAKSATKPETTLKAKVAVDTTKIEKVATKTEPTKMDSSKAAISQKPDTSKGLATKIPAAKPAPEEKPEIPAVQWGTDPFVRDWVLATEIKDLKLKAVTLSGVKAYALINDQILERGEAIMGKRIIDIEKDKVILEQGGRQFTLFLGE